MRRVIFTVVALVVAVGGAFFYLMSNLDSLVKAATESIGTEAAGVPVQVAEVRIKLSQGTGSITGLSVANPPGFKAASAIRLGEIALQLDQKSVTHNPVVIREIRVIAPQVTYDLAAAGSNLASLRGNIAAFAQGRSAPGATADKPAGKDDVTFVIDRLSLDPGTLTLATPLADGKTSVPLPPIVLTDIGKAAGGTGTAEIAQQILGAVLQSATDAVNGLPGK
jgi:hypothetical protein